MGNFHISIFFEQIINKKYCFIMLYVLLITYCHFKVQNFQYFDKTTVETLK